MYNPALHERAFKAASSIEIGEMPSVREASDFVFSEWPTASPARREELANALQLVVLHHNTSKPPPPARPERAVSDLVREWYSATLAARRIFKDNLADFISAHKWIRD